MITRHQPATLDDLYRVEGKAELVNGRIVHYVASGDLPSKIAFEIAVRLRAYATKTGLGKAYSDGLGYAMVPPLSSGRQTFQPDARAITLAARHDVPEFLASELERRRALGYPPFRHLVRIVCSGPDSAGPERALTELKAGLGGEELLGPAPLLRLRNRHRAQLVGKTDRPRALASRASALLSAAAPAMRRAGLAVVVDVDPQSL